jgi:hypothetical protein
MSAWHAGRETEGERSVFSSINVSVYPSLAYQTESPAVEKKTGPNSKGEFEHENDDEVSFGDAGGVWLVCRSACIG